MQGKRVLFGWQGVDYAGTTGPRETSEYAMNGGIINEQDFSILVETAAFGEVTPPGTDRRDIVTVCVDSHGIPNYPDDPTNAARVNARVVKVGRFGGGLTFTLKTAQKG